MKRFLASPSKRLQALHVIARAERGSNQGLSLTARKNRRSVGARQNSDFDPDVADLVKLASIRTALLVDNLLAENPFAQNLVVLLDFRLAAACSRLPAWPPSVPSSIARPVRSSPISDASAYPAHRPSVRQSCLQTLEVRLVELRRRNGALRLSDLLAQFSNGGANLFDSAWPNSIASTTVSSFTSFAPDSIMTMPSAVPTTMMLSRPSRISV